MSGFDAASNLALKALRRLQSVHKPFVRRRRRGERAREHAAFRQEVAEIERELAEIAADPRSIVIGPWLGEVGYEVLYWIPFLRWFVDAHGISRDRLIAVTRGGLEAMYGELASRYVDIFDVMTPQEFAEANARRRTDREGGGQKQTSMSELEVRLLGRVMQHLSLPGARVCSPALLFKSAWYPFAVLKLPSALNVSARAPAAVF